MFREAGGGGRTDCDEIEKFDCIEHKKQHTPKLTTSSNQ